MGYHATAYSCFDDPDKAIYNKLTNNFVPKSEYCPYDNDQSFEIFYDSQELTRINFNGNFHEKETQQFLEILAKHSTQRIEIFFSGEDEKRWKYVIENGKIEEFPLLEIYTKNDLYLMPTKDIIEYLESIGFTVAKKEN